MQLSNKSYEMIKWLWQKYASLTKKETYVNNLKNVYFDNEVKSKETIVMLHGITADKYVWPVFSKKFTKNGFRVIIPDIPPFGESDYNKNISYSIEYQAQNLKKFMDKLNIKQAHVFGNSMGGGIAAKFSILFPDSTKSLVLFDNMGIYSAKRTEFLNKLEKGENMMLIKNKNDLKQMLELVYYKVPLIPFPIMEELLKQGIANYDKNKKVFEDLLKEEWYLEEELDKIKCKTMVVWGKYDKVFDVDTVNIMKKIKNLEIEIIDNCGHMPMNEKPNITSKKVLDFLNKAIN